MYLSSLVFVSYSRAGSCAEECGAVWCRREMLAA
jgi:hypothetical protein